MDNPLLKLGDRPDFAAVRPEHVAPAIDTLLAAAEAALERSVGPDMPADYEALSAVLDVAVERLRRAWGVVGHLHSVVDTPALRAAYTEQLPRITDFYTRLGADERLYAKYKAVAASPQAAGLTPARRRALANALRDFVLGGAELQGAARERFAWIKERCADLSQRFGEHVLDATDQFSMFVDASELDGVPAAVVQAARDAAAADGRDGCKLTLQWPCFGPVMQYAHRRALRQALFTAYQTRASELGPAALDNTELIRELLELRQEEAALLGLDSYAHLSLVPKMAGSPAEVMGFVRDLARRARPHAERDRSELHDFAARELGLPDLQPWDRAYASEKLQSSRFAFSSDEVKQYLTEPRVLDGLFRLIERLFDVDIRPVDAPVWHPSVRCFDVARSGRPLAAFYLDLHARAGKQGGAWMDELQTRWLRPDGGGLQLPVAYMVCNFAPPVGGKPALLSHDDLLTLFHEFGHGLHHMLTQVDERAVAGIAGVEWDAVELPSQFMENFCWQYDVLQGLSAHVDSGQPLPRALFDKMLAARCFQSGLQMTRHSESALVDMRLHLETGAAARARAIAAEVQEEIAIMPAAPFSRQLHSFTHLFDGSYAAGYYGYAWAEVLSADAFSAFEESGILDADTGRRYREAILEVGGSRPAAESFKDFRGREPRLDALLRHHGLA
jgi:oligopeptidase A